MIQLCAFLQRWKTQLFFLTSDVLQSWYYCWLAPFCSQRLTQNKHNIFIMRLVQPHSHTSARKHPRAFTNTHKHPNAPTNTHTHSQTHTRTYTHPHAPTRTSSLAQHFHSSLSFAKTALDELQRPTSSAFSCGLCDHAAAFEQIYVLFFHAKGFHLT